MIFKNIELSWHNAIFFIYDRLEFASFPTENQVFALTFLRVGPNEGDLFEGGRALIRPAGRLHHKG
jgi:hypothetical protein